MSQQNRGALVRRSLAVIGAAAIALAGMAAGGSAAYATDAPQPGPGDITGTTGTLTIHKHAGDPGAQGNGTEITDPAALAALGAGLEGVEFSVQRVNYDGSPIDLTTDAGWNQAQGAQAGNVSSAPYSLTAQTTTTTGAGGDAIVPNLPYGLYLVTETSPGANPVVSPAQPFLVSVPYPNSEDSTWLYNVHVYPKNKLNTTTPTKTVSEPGNPVLGQELTWMITAPIPPLAEGDTYRKFVVTDDLDERLDLTGVVVRLDGAELTEGTDYTLAPAALPAAGGPNTTITLTGALAGLAGKGNVTVELKTKVTSLGADGKISNKGLVNVNDSLRETNDEQVNYGPLKIVKKAAQNPNYTLAGAEFTLHKSKDGAALDAPGTLTTNSAGEIVVDGLWTGSGADLTETYWLKETKAPAGYALPQGDAAWTQVTVTAGSAASVVPVAITNTQQQGPNLPLTGSSGTAMFMAGGLALLLTAGGSALIAARRKQASAR
ncbi:SpaH/EbpB family LPXTG-anchored major pilin [Leucobacter sp. wl10]|uniref:SpaH/EbpB family LPXTG-anchored major pilin n=1 Tax=Leucobacter sp. wl10 TaxID=2304677 RepID=UPI000E5B122B|nr:SpaH/EbpB family LPXTG-anchored major pilin [Leucobacter sp. wl10]RGE16750.1 isopeptide-forming domain-containing fimbrial protein [Leucobacter sp. wl10]